MGLTLVAAAAFALASTTFPAGGTIPLAAIAGDCGGSNRSPQLSWQGAPASTKSFALVVNDPDAPGKGGFDHWILYDVPATVHEIPSGDPIPAGSRAGENGYGRAGYYGPCPPPGPAHHYVFTLYALDVAQVPDAGRPLTSWRLAAAIEGHVLARAQLEATARHP